MNPESIKKRFVSLYNSEIDGLFRYCFLRTSSREIAIDLAQDAFMKLWDYMSKEEKNVLNERAFLYTITRNLIIDWYRKKKSISLESLDDEENEIDYLDKLVLEENTQEMLELSADGRYVIEKIKELEEPYQQVVFLRFAQDLKPKEISEILNLPVNLVSVRITRGLEKLKEKFLDKPDKKHE